MPDATDITLDTLQVIVSTCSLAFVIAFPPIQYSAIPALFHSGKPLVRLQFAIFLLLLVSTLLFVIDAALHIAYVYFDCTSLNMRNVPVWVSTIRRNVSY
jgi:hypothetical protein